MNVWTCWAGHEHLTPRAARRCRGRQAHSTAVVLIAVLTTVAVFGCLAAAGAYGPWWVAGALACFIAGVAAGVVVEVRSE